MVRAEELTEPDMNIDYKQDRFDDLIRDKKKLHYHYSQIIKFVNNHEVFLLDDGTLFFRLLANFRKYARQPLQTEEHKNNSLSDIFEGSDKQGNNSHKRNLNFGAAGLILCGIVSVCLTILGVFKILAPETIAYSILLVVALFFLPAVVGALLLRKMNQDTREILDSLFNQLKTTYEDNIFTARKFLRIKSEAIRLGLIDSPKDNLPITGGSDLVMDSGDDEASRGWSWKDDVADSRDPDEVPDNDDEVMFENIQMPDPFHDALDKDYVKQTQFKIGALFTSICGDILNISEGIYNQRIEQLIKDSKGLPEPKSGGDI